MTEPDQAVIGRLSADFAVMASYLARASADLRELSRIVAERPPVAPPPVSPYAPQVATQYQWPAPPNWSPAPAPPATPPSSASPPPVPSLSVPPRAPAAGTRAADGWIGKALAVAGVAVTLVGVVLLVVLAAQAGILAPGVRVGAGAALSAALVGIGWRLNQRPGGRVGAIALAATGIAAAYIDVIAVTSVYGWLPAAAGLAIAALVAAAGLTLARRWDSEHLGLLVLVPLIGLAPAVAGGITLLVVGFMLALSAASLPVQLGRDWTWLHAARIAAATLPLLVALVAVGSDSGEVAWLAGACGIAAVLALVGAVLLLPQSRHPAGVALLTAAGTLPVLSLSLAADRVTSAVMAAALAAAMLGIVLVGDRLPALTGAVRQIWGALAAVSALIAVAVAFDGPVAAPVLLAMAVVVAMVGRGSGAARWSAMGLAAIGALYYLDNAPLTTMVTATELSPSIAVSTLISSLLLGMCAAVVAWSWTTRGALDGDVVRLLWAGAAIAALYAVTMFTVTAGVLFGGDGEYGFFAGHVAATICWIGVAAAVLRYAAKLPRADRSLPIGGGMALVAAAVAKLFLFDLGTLDGIFRVVVFIVVGLVLLAMGAGYARLLAQQDQQDQTV
jgi:uncharacterized membrane protein